MDNINMDRMNKDNYGYLEKKNKSNRSYYRYHKVLKVALSVVRTLFLIGMAYVLLYPLLNLLTMTFRPPAEVADPSVVWIPKHLTMDNIFTAIKQLKYWDALKNTLIVAGGSAIFQMIFCSMAGYGFARFNFREKKILFALVIFTIIVPPQTTSLSNFVEFRFFSFFGLTKLIGAITGTKPLVINLLNTPWTFYIPSILCMGLRSGLFIYIFRQFFRSMPKDLENAAKIDGCGAFKVFVRVMAPNALPAYLTVFLFSLVWHWNDYALTSLYYQTKNKPLALALSSFQTTLQNVGIKDFTQQYAILNAAAFLFVLPLLLLYIFAQRYFIESVNMTGIKG